MHLIEILLPLKGPAGVEFPATEFEQLARELTEQFGGVTAFTRSPAEGRWKNQGSTEHDDIVVMEVMTEVLDRDWWEALRIRLMRQFHQEELIIRCRLIEML